MGFAWEAFGPTRKQAGTARGRKTEAGHSGVNRRASLERPSLMPGLSRVRFLHTFTLKYVVLKDKYKIRRG